jgi:succinate dehydrogenase / fumarate reductase membrane anchor subunit
MSLRSPLGAVLGDGSAKKGAAHWWSQRTSAVALALLGPWLLISLLALGDLNHAAVAAWIAAPLNAVLLSLLIATVAYHAQLGLQVVIEDYVSSKGTKVVVLTLINFALAVLAVLGVFSVLRIALATVGNG